MISFTGILLFVTGYLNVRISQKKPAGIILYLLLVATGIFSIFKISDNRCWTTFHNCDEWDSYITAQYIDKAENPLIITDFTSWCGIGKFLEIMAKCESENINVIYMSPEHKRNLKELPANLYSEVFIVNASGKLVEDMKSQFQGKVDSVDIGGWTPMWQLRY